MTDFQKMDIMANENQDIRMFPTLDSFSSTKKKSTVTIQVNEETAQMLMRQIATGEPMTHYVALYVVNKKQFDAIK